MQKARARLRSHGGGAAAVSGVLFMINVVAGPGPWFLIPSAILGVGFALHAVRSSYRRTALQEQMTQSGLDWQKIEAGADAASASARRGELARGTAARRPSE